MVTKDIVKIIDSLIHNNHFINDINSIDNTQDPKVVGEKQEDCVIYHSRAINGSDVFEKVEDIYRIPKYNLLYGDFRDIKNGINYDLKVSKDKEFCCSITLDSLKNFRGVYITFNSDFTMCCIIDSNYLLNLYNSGKIKTQGDYIGYTNYFREEFIKDGYFVFIKKGSC